MVIYLPWLPWFDAYTVVPFVFIRSRCRGDEGLLQHELVHVAQFWRRPFTHSFRHLFSPRYRLECEVEAYRKSLEYHPDRLDNFAFILATKYGFHVTLPEARALLAVT